MMCSKEQGFYQSGADWLPEPGDSFKVSPRLCAKSWPGADDVFTCTANQDGQISAKSDVMNCNIGFAVASFQFIRVGEES